MRASILFLSVAHAWPDAQHNLPRAEHGQQDFSQALQLQLQTSHLAAKDLQYTRANGQPYPNPTSAERIGETGPILLKHHHLIENLAHFVRERIPERVVHAAGAGAHGVFTTTTDFAKQHTMMDVFSEVGKQTPITVRFSTVGGEAGSADQARDPRGFAMKFRTQKGIWDIVMNNTPVFFLRDPAKFPFFVHTQKRNPQTHRKDPNAVWDYFGQNAESLHQFLRLFSDAGTPQGFVNMDGFTSHSYRWIKKDSSWVYVKLHAVSDQGIHNFTAAESEKIAGENPDYAAEDLFTRIESGKFPSWTVYAQVLTPAEAEKFRYNVLDLTKDWPENLVAKHEIGKFELNQNPQNYFAEIEQAAFSPSNVVDGWEISEDPVLQARAFSYPDAQRYRLGTNFQQIPVNCPMNPVGKDGVFGGVTGNQGSRPNYLSSFQSINIPPRQYDDSNHTIWTAGAIRYLSQVSSQLLIR
ncbi:uncharacterized protein MELLADRAFT_40847 [Melampsora larici-populina 98AG31]|uniref:Catalase core domain-containing protein n=1 Tax=Melampsora larici-populina (strain 98AG31 / pathotype 3-4-7) TaxID=747676 RepID=F4SAC0_MELLP|nr:uncharacterized protein MELLADRAFT_40847 [Melampsora larici-populina 98AG31]EGF98428.1 hypothetical protein MELLADRAFT_40847 [Melampsora larici-populina 98AG31]